MVMRYLRRPPKPTLRNAALRKVERPPIKPADAAPAVCSVEITSEERAAVAQPLAYFCVACGREHASDGVRQGDVVCAEAEIAALVRRAR